MASAAVLPGSHLVQCWCRTRTRSSVLRMDLHALEDLKRLKYRYLRTLDQKQWDDFGETLAPEATADYGPALAFVGRSTIVEFMRSSLDAEIITEHHVGHPEIEIDGDTATGTWYLQDVVIARSQRMMLRGAAFYEDRYARSTEGAWRITHTGYQRSYEYWVSLDDLPSLKFTQP